MADRKKQTRKKGTRGAPSRRRRRGRPPVVPPRSPEELRKEYVEDWERRKIAFATEVRRLCIASRVTLVSPLQILPAEIAEGPEDAEPDGGGPKPVVEEAEASGADRKEGE